MAADDGDDLHVTVEGSRVARAPRDLRAFAQVALGPGETRTVTMTLDAADLAFFDASAGAWEVERTDYELAVGGQRRRRARGRALPDRVGAERPRTNGCAKAALTVIQRSRYERTGKTEASVLNATGRRPHEGACGPSSLDFSVDGE